MIVEPISPDEIPQQVVEAIKIVDGDLGRRVRRGRVWMLSIMVAILVLYTLFTAWMIMLLPAVIPMILLAIQGISVAFMLATLTEIRVIFSTDDDGFPSVKLSLPQIICGFLFTFGGIPVLLMVIYEWFEGMYRERYKPGLHKDARKELVKILHANFQIWNLGLELIEIDETPVCAEQLEELRERLIRTSHRVHGCLSQSKLGSVRKLTGENARILEELLTYREIFMRIVGQERIEQANEEMTPFHYF